MPTTKSNKYSVPVKTDGKLEVQAIAYEPASGKTSSVSLERFDISRKDWKIVDNSDEKAYNIIDGDPNTDWVQSKEKKMPIDLVIDFGKDENLIGFKYLPSQTQWAGGVITNYKFFVSLDNKEWKLVSDGEFSNINNNPVWQTKKFEPVKARFMKLQALKNAWNNQDARYGEVDVITK